MGNALGLYESRYVVKKAKGFFLGRYCMLQSWPDNSDPTVLALCCLLLATC